MSIPPFPTEPYAQVSHDVLEAELLVVIRHDGVTLADLRGIFDRSFGALGAAAKSGLFVPVGPAIAIYYGDPQATFDLEVGFPAMGAPTADVPSPAGVIHTSALPAGPAAVLSHVGPFDSLGASWATLIGEAHGTARGVYIEVYVSDPSVTDASALRTDLVLPLE